MTIARSLVRKLSLFSPVLCGVLGITQPIWAATVLEEPARLAGRFLLKIMMTGGITHEETIGNLGQLRAAHQRRYGTGPKAV
jgi:hypothetical protein